MVVGIDLGTTFCCVAFIDEDTGKPEIVKNSHGNITTPSVVYFDGKKAYVGETANEFKLKFGISSSFKPFEHVKRDIGKPVEVSPDLYPADAILPTPAPYEVAGFKYGAHGISAIILRKLKKDTIAYLKKIRKLDKSITEKDIELPAVITVPAYYGEKERQEVKIAGYAAGLNVVGIINEPTAAALAYGFAQSESKKIMVFDLGGGTLDITILEMRGQDEAKVIASEGINQLGGVDWDRIIAEYIIAQIYKRLGDEKRAEEIVKEKGFEIQELAIKAKHELSEKESTTITIPIDDMEIELTLYRKRPEGSSIYSIDDIDTFYFKERSQNLLSQCKVTTEKVLEKSNLTWKDIDEIILAGGACRKPMIAELLEEISGKKIGEDLKVFNPDTAIATGAAIYGYHKGKKKITDVLAHSIGVKYVEEGRYYIEHLLKKNQPLPASAERKFKAGPNAIVEIYEGESNRPDECSYRGRITLDNFEGYVNVKMSINGEGILKVIAEYEGGRKELKINNEIYRFDERAKELREKIQSIQIE